MPCIVNRYYTYRLGDGSSISLYLTVCPQQKGRTCYHSTPPSTPRSSRVAGNLFTEGFDVAPDAPSTYRALKAHLDAGKRLVVYDGGSEGTIYVTPAVNHAFRAWHDFSHWTGKHDFSVRGECAVFAMQRQHLLDLYGDNKQTERSIDILRGAENDRRAPLLRAPQAARGRSARLHRRLSG